MQSTPSAGSWAASSGGAGPRAGHDDTGAPHRDTVLPARNGSTPARDESMPALVVRPRSVWRILGPLFVVTGGVLVALGMLWGVAVIAFGALFAPMLWMRIIVSGVSIRRRGWLGGRRTIRLDTIDTLRLRRLPFGLIRIFGKRGFRIGPLWTVPLTLRLQSGADIQLQLRCVWWDGWQSVARFLSGEPGMNIDERTRGRLDTYVGPSPVPVVTSVRL